MENWKGFYRGVSDSDVVGEDSRQGVVECGEQEAGSGSSRAADRLGDARELELGNRAVVVLHVHHERAVGRAPHRRWYFCHLLCRNEKVLNEILVLYFYEAMS